MSETLNTNGATEITAAQLFGAEEKPAAEAKAPVETVENSEAQEAKTEDAEAKEIEGEESKDESEKDTEDSDDDAPKGEKQKGFGKRISKLVKRNQTLNQELEYWKQQALGSKAEGAPEKVSQRSEAAKEDPRPRAEDFDSYEDYQVALSEYGARKALAPALDEIKKTISGPKAEAEADRQAKAFEKRTKEFVKEHKDYAEAVQALAGIDVHKAVERAIVESDHGPAMLYELGKDPDLAEKIAELPPHLQLKEIGKIEARIEARLEAKKTQPLKTTRAPAPPNPVGAKSEGKRTVDDPNLSPLDYFKLRNEEERQRRNQYF